uniref:DUF4283 domain-containing protein n=1 Tax=Chenopodium quinoa TaxID=63459 RepID=A0A803MN58_CHEQI
MKRVKKNLWRLTDNVAICMIETNLFVIQFFDEADKVQVLEGRPWAFDNQLLLLQELIGDDQPSEMSFQFSPFWIMVLNVPFSRRNPRSSDSFGGFMEFDDSDPLGWEKFMRIKVMIDVTKLLRRGMKIAVGGENTKWVGVKYEQLGDSCYYFGRLDADREKEWRWVENLSRGKAQRRPLYSDPQAIRLGPPGAAVTDPKSKKEVLRPFQIQNGCESPFDDTIVDVTLPEITTTANTPNPHVLIASQSQPGEPNILLPLPGTKQSSSWKRVERRVSGNDFDTNMSDGGVA